MELIYTYLDGIGIGNSIEMGLTKEDVEYICHSGSNDDEVSEVTMKEYVQTQLKKHTRKKLYNIVDYQLAGEANDIDTREKAERYIVWLAAWNISDELE